MTTSGTTAGKKDPAIKNLAKALAQPLTGRQPKISPKLLKMFRAVEDWDLSSKEQDKMAYARFKKARKLY